MHLYGIPQWTKSANNKNIILKIIMQGISNKKQQQNVTIFFCYIKFFLNRLTPRIAKKKKRRLKYAHSQHDMPRPCVLRNVQIYISSTRIQEVKPTSINNMTIHMHHMHTPALALVQVQTLQCICTHAQYCHVIGWPDLFFNLICLYYLYFLSIMECHSISFHKGYSMKRLLP